MKTVVALLVLGVALVGGACARSEKYGVVDSAAPAVLVKDILLSEAYGGKDVRMSGTIAMQCASSGCWFFLDDGTGRMLVDLKGLGLGLPAAGREEGPRLRHGDHRPERAGGAQRQGSRGLLNVTFWGLSTRNVLRHRTRNTLTALGITLSVLALYSILSFNGGFMRNLDEELKKTGSSSW